jgi:RimJ/RimL family protein N-acetyltransferase
MEFFQAPMDRAASDTMADRCQALLAEHGWGFWAVEKKLTPTFIGFVGLHTPTAALPFSPCVEVGWRLAYQYWGKGYATEAALGALRIGFEVLGLSEIVAFTADANLRSRKVMEKLHMQEATETFEHPDIPEGHELRQHCLYRLYREQWL